MDSTASISATGPAAFGVIAERFRRAGQPDKAVALCREGLEKFPDHLSARVTLGWSLLDMGEHQEAFDQLKSVLKRAPDNLAAIRGLAELHERGIGLVFDSLSDSESEETSAFGRELALDADLDPVMPAPVVSAPLVAAAVPVSYDDLDPILEPEMPALVMEMREPVMPAFAAETRELELPVLAVETSDPMRFEIEDVIDEVEPDSMFDMSGIFADEPAPQPVSLFARAPLALRDEADEARVDELHDWLSRVRDRRTGSVSQSMAS